MIQKSLYSDIQTNDEEIRESGRLLLPPESLETFGLISNVNNLGAIGEPIVFAQPNTIAVCRLNPDALNWDITGIIAPVSEYPNKLISITNINPFPNRSIRFQNNDPASLPVNRFLFNGNTITLLPNETISFRYDNLFNRWRTESKV